MADGRNMEKYQAILLDYPNVTLQTTTTLNLATLFSDVKENTALQHDYLEIIDQVNSSRLDLLDQLLAASDWELYTNRSSFKANDEPGM